MCRTLRKTGVIHAGYIKSIFLILSANLHSLFVLSTFTRIISYSINIHDNIVNSANFNISISENIYILLSHAAKHFRHYHTGYLLEC